MLVYDVVALHVMGSQFKPSRVHQAQNLFDILTFLEMQILTANKVNKIVRPLA